MPKYLGLDRMFHALGDSSRRAMVERLSRGPASVSELAQPFEMALPTVVQHLGVLAAAGIVTSAKVGRVRTYQLVPGALGLPRTGSAGSDCPPNAAWTAQALRSASRSRPGVKIADVQVPHDGIDGVPAYGDRPSPRRAQGKQQGQAESDHGREPADQQRGP